MGHCQVKSIGPSLSKSAYESLASFYDTQRWGPCFFACWLAVPFWQCPNQSQALRKLVADDDLMLWFLWALGDERGWNLRSPRRQHSTGLKTSPGGCSLYMVTSPTHTAGELWFIMYTYLWMWCFSTCDTLAQHLRPLFYSMFCWYNGSLTLAS